MPCFSYFVLFVGVLGLKWPPRIVLKAVMCLTEKIRMLVKLCSGVNSVLPAVN